jgi:hypothetical protein
LARIRRQPDELRRSYLNAHQRARSSGTWDDDDYDVFDGEHNIGAHPVASADAKGRPWFWSITARIPQSTHDRGYAESREQAMADFKMAWLRKTVVVRGS